MLEISPASIPSSNDLKETIMADAITSDEILDFAIAEEEKAANFYAGLTDKMEKPWMKEIFEQFSKEEWGHKNKLMGIKEGRTLIPSEEKIQDLKITEYIVDMEPSPDMSYQDALILAMKAEKKAFKLYTDLAARVTDEGVKNTLQSLAQEEAKHKLRFEVEYDEFVLTDN